MILTPVTLWKDFNDTLPFKEEVVSQWEDGGILRREVYFLGRQTQQGRVKIFATYSVPKGAARYPAVMILFEAGMLPDAQFVERYLKSGYAVLCVDYCGENGTGRHTVYPPDVDYANYMRAGRAIEYAEPSAKETSWYEWAAVARYAARYLASKKEVTAVGAIGLRTGGEVLFKIAPYAPLSCMISVCAAGWLAYRGIEKFSEEEKHVFDEERHRFIAGIDSQSYAPYIKCPVLLISAINDKKYNYDRVYDTFRQINPEVEKAILFSSHGNGLIGSHSLTDIDLFLDKYLKGRSVFISGPVTFTAGEDEEGNLVVRGKYDENGELDGCGIFYSEETASFRARDWARVIADQEEFSANEGTIPLSVYDGCNRVLVYTFARYSNGFSVTSSIREIRIGKRYRNSCAATRVIYSTEEGLNGFAVFRRRARCIADCFTDGEAPLIKAGYGGITGITARSGLITYRVGAPRYAPPENAAIRFDAYAAEDATLRVVFYQDDGEEVGYSYETKIGGGGKWKSLVLDPADFKSETGICLRDFHGVLSVAFLSEGKVLVNNVVWL